MTVRRGIRGTVLVGAEERLRRRNGTIRQNRKSDVNLDLNPRPLTTYFSSVNADFDPNEAMNTLLDHQANKAMDGELANTPTAKEVLALIAKGVLRNAPFAVWRGVRAIPKATLQWISRTDLTTITKKDIESVEVSLQNGNYFELDEPITKENAYEVITGLVSLLDDTLREKKCYLYCSKAISDAYNTSYKNNSKGISYNGKFEQTVVEGSNGTSSSALRLENATRIHTHIRRGKSTRRSRPGVGRGKRTRQGLSAGHAHIHDAHVPRIPVPHCSQIILLCCQAQVHVRDGEVEP